MATLAELRAKLAAQDNNNSNSSAYDNDARYPFWNIANDTTAVLRFLPDGNEDNPFFWVERQMIKLLFPGVKGQNESKEVVVSVPCVEMWEGESCPILAKVRPMYKDPNLETIASKYWKKRSYIFQGFVVTDPGLFDHKGKPLDVETPENPIRRFIINPSIFKLIKAALMDTEMEDLPTDYVAGTDFRLTKTQNGDWANYDTSSWSRKERTLSVDEAASLDKYELNDLSTFLPKRPDADHLHAMEEMFDASLAGELYDTARWGQYYRPWGVDAPASTKTSPSVATKTPIVVKKNEMPMPSDEAPKTSTADVLALLKARTSK